MSVPLRTHSLSAVEDAPAPPKLTDEFSDTPSSQARLCLRIKLFLQQHFEAVLLSKVLYLETDAANYSRFSFILGYNLSLLGGLGGKKAYLESWLPLKPSVHNRLCWKCHLR